MARLGLWGWELQSVTALMEFDTVSGTPTIDTTIKRSGAASMRCNCTGTAKYVQHQYGSGNNSYMSVWIYIASLPNANAILLRLWDGAAGGNIQLKSDGKLQYYDGSGAQLGSDTSALSLNTWYNIQIKSLEFGGFTGEEGRFNGSSIGSNSTNFSGDFVRVGVQSAVTCDIYFDDLIINDTGGSVENSWPSIYEKVIHGHPNAAGDSNTWEKSGGGAGSSTNYQDVDEITPDNGTTYLVRDTGASNTPKDLYNIESSATIGLVTGDTIVCIAVGARGGSTSATSAAGRNVNVGIKAGGTEAWSGSIDWSINGYTTHADPVPRVYKYVAYVDPSDAAAWTLSKIDSLQIGVRANSAATTDVRVSTVWVAIGYIPSTSAIKTVNALAKASVKTFNSLAIASVKSINSLQ